MISKVPFQWTILAAIFLVATYSSCKKEEIVQSDIPEITITSVSPSTAKELSDSITFQIFYKDGNGDLGENNPDVTNLFVTDNRINVTEGFRIQQLAPSGSDIAIQGTLTVVLKNTGITNGSTSQKVSWTIYVKDRAGNESNRAVSSEITVNQ